ncbi:MAG TPA: Gfo/Idh/MocA family oxidoreductase [candidate division Zixibacteria bacterium]|nr:Gfo/Idh/MocA family oxidoreductase [candidate division Zixibacteria bacterium]
MTHTNRTDRIAVGVIGLGNWGKNLLREFALGPDSVVPLACDAGESARERARRQYPGLQVTADPEDILKSDVAAVVVATPPGSHFELASAAIAAGKDVFVEKPLVLDVAEGERLVAAAEAAGRILMVGHIMEYHPAVTWLKKYISDGHLGAVYYAYSRRVNLGQLRDNENAMWSLAPHDISMISYLLDDHPRRATAVGHDYLQKGIEDVVFATFEYGEGRLAHVHASWLDPHKIRSLTLVGQKQMAVFSDTEPTEKIRVYDKGVEVSNKYDSYAEYLTLRHGDCHIPMIPNQQPLTLECRHFIACVRDRVRPLSDGHDGLRVLRALDAAQKSLDSGGTPCEIANPVLETQT